MLFIFSGICYRDISVSSSSQLESWQNRHYRRAYEPFPKTKWGCIVNQQIALQNLNLNTGHKQVLILIIQFQVTESWVKSATHCNSYFPFLTQENILWVSSKAKEFDLINIFKHHKFYFWRCNSIANRSRGISCHCCWVSAWTVYWIHSSSPGLAHCFHSCGLFEFHACTFQVPHQTPHSTRHSSASSLRKELSHVFTCFSAQESPILGRVFWKRATANGSKAFLPHIKKFRIQQKNFKIIP